MVNFRKLFIFGALIAFLATAALAASLLTSPDVAEARNPPSTLLTTVGIDSGQPTNATDDPTPVWAIAEANGRYYIGGDFTQVGGETQAFLAAIEVATGQLDPNFRPVLANANGNAEVLTLALSPDGNDLYIGGRFTSVDGVFHTRIAKLDARTGALDTSFNASASAAVETIVVDSTGVYVGGAFDTIGGGTSPHIAKLDLNSGALDPAFTTTADGNVLDLELSGGDLFVGGNFDTINGLDQPHLVRLNASSGLVSPNWAPDFAVPHRVLALSVAPDGTMVFAGTSGTPSQLGNTVWGYTASGIRTWQKVGAGDVQAIEALGDSVYVGTHGQFVYTEARYLLDTTPADLADPVTEQAQRNPDFPQNGYVENAATNPNAEPREKFYALDPSTGDALPWDPHGNSVTGVWELETGASGLLAGGDFTQIFNPDPNSQIEPAVTTPHFAIFAGIGSLDAAPEPLFSFDCTTNICTFDASDSNDDVSISSYAWDFGNGQTTTGSAATATLADNTTHEVTLTVTDNAGNSAERTQLVTVGNAGTPITPIATASTNSSNSVHTVQLPNNAQAGDVAIAFVSMNVGTTVATAPLGWVYVDDQINGQLRTYVYYRTLDAAEAGSNATFNLSASVKTDLTISTFRGVDGTNPIAAFNTAATATNRAEHIAPALTFAGDATVLQYWAERTSASTELFAAPDLATLSTSFGTLGGRINTTLALDPNVRTGSSPASAAVTEHHSRRVLGWSLSLNEGAPPPPPTSTTCPAVMLIGDINDGIAARDGATGTGYLLWSNQDVHTRFRPAPFSRNADHLIAVQFINGQWHVDNNSTLTPFTPAADDCLVAELDFTNDTATTLQGTNTTINGIDAGYTTGDLQLFADRFGGNPNNGEFDATGTQIGTSPPPTSTTCPAVMLIGDINDGIAARDGATGTGYLLWSNQDVHTRFRPAPFSRNADHLIAVQFINGQWHVDNNSTLTPFTPAADDCLVAELDFTNDTATTLQGTNTTINGIDAGYTTGDLQLFADRFGGNPNNGEFDATGTQIGTSPPPTSTTCPAVMLIGDINDGIAARDGATGTGYLLWSNQDVHTRFRPAPFSRNADHLIAVQFINGQWHVDNNSTLTPFTPAADDCLVAELDFTNDTATTLQGTNTTINGIDAGYTTGDLQLFADRFGGNPNNGEFDATGTQIFR